MLCDESMFSSLRLIYGISTSPFLAGVKVPARGPDDGRLVVKYGVLDPLLLSVTYTGQDMDPLRPRQRWNPSSRSASQGTHFRRKKRRAFLHHRFLVFLILLWDSSLEMGFWSLKWRASMDLDAVSLLCFRASSSTYSKQQRQQYVQSAQKDVQSF